MKPSTHRFFQFCGWLVLIDIFLRPIHSGKEQNKERRPESVCEHSASNASSQNPTNNNYPNHLSPRNTLNTLHNILKLGFGVLAYKNRSRKEVGASMAISGANVLISVMFFVG
jgi:hypothetical protein